jgi:Domain of unknown function (DUF4386)
MYRTGLMPPRLAMLGVIGGPLIFLSAIAVLFGAYEQDGLHALFSLPEGAFEAAFAIYLIVKASGPHRSSPAHQLRSAVPGHLQPRTRRRGAPLPARPPAGRRARGVAGPRAPRLPHRAGSLRRPAARARAARRGAAARAQSLRGEAPRKPPPSTTAHSAAECRARQPIAGALRARGARRGRGGTQPRWRDRLAVGHRRGSLDAAPAGGQSVVSARAGPAAGPRGFGLRSR